MSSICRLFRLFIGTWLVLWLPNTALAAPTLANIEARQTLNVCIWPEYFSVTYQNPRTGELEGIDIELSQALASDLGVQVQYVKSHFGRFMDDLEVGTCDIAMFGLGNTSARRKRVAFSQPYLASPMYAVTTKQHPFMEDWNDMDQDGAIVCVQAGTYMERAMQKRLKHANMVKVKRPNEREIEVLSGRADVFITDYPYGKKMLHLYDWVKLIAPPKDSPVFHYAYAVAKNDPQWLQRVDQFVADIKVDGRLHNAAAHNGLSPIVVTK